MSLSILSLALGVGLPTLDAAPGPSGQHAPGESPDVEHIRSPLLISRERPDFPQKAARAGIRDATVHVTVVINVAGDVAPVEVLDCSASGFGFEEEALATVANWRFTPAFADGRSVSVYQVVTIRFHREAPALPA